MLVSVKMNQVHKIVKKWLSSTLPDDCKPYSRLEIVFRGEGYLHLSSFNILALKLHGNKEYYYVVAELRNRMNAQPSTLYLFTASKHWRRLPGKFLRRFCSKGCIPSKFSTSPLRYLDEKHDSVCDVSCWWRSRRKKRHGRLQFLSVRVSLCVRTITSGVAGSPWVSLCFLF